MKPEESESSIALEYVVRESHEEEIDGRRVTVVDAAVLTGASVVSAAAGRVATATARRPSLKVALLVAAYLGAAVAANLIVAAFGPAALPVSAFLLIPFDLCTRDVLHERWHGRGLKLRMLVLIAAGSALSFAAQPASGRVALASAVSFAAAATLDAIVYAAAARQPRAVRMNLSNACGAVLDSVVFPLIAFGATTAALSGSQAGAKFVGGLFWSWVFLAAIRWRRRRRGEGCQMRGAFGVRCAEELESVSDSAIAAAWCRRHRRQLLNCSGYIKRGD